MAKGLQLNSEKQAATKTYIFQGFQKCATNYVTTRSRLCWLDLNPITKLGHILVCSLSQFVQLKNRNVQLKKVTCALRSAKILVKMMIYTPIGRFCAVVNPA